MPDEHGETRVERNERFGQSDLTPDKPILEHSALTLWEWFWNISQSVQRVRQGAAIRISPADFIHWQKLTGVNLHPSEYDVLKSVDQAYCIAMNMELEAFRERQRDANTDPEPTG